jgi:hypothetical protein
MRIISSITTPFMFAVLFTVLAAPQSARASDHGLLQERVKVSLNEMVTEVRTSESPAAKRAVMERFLDRFESRSRIAEKLPLNDEQRAGLTALQTRFAGYAGELKGTENASGVADKDLDAFASFMQQDLEQAAASWGSGGIYLSTGAVIIILLILLLIT